MEFHQLVRTWLVCASCQLPVISKSFELQIQVGGGKGSNKVRILLFTELKLTSGTTNQIVCDKSSLNYPKNIFCKQKQDERSESFYSIQSFFTRRRWIELRFLQFPQKEPLPKPIVLRKLSTFKLNVRFVESLLRNFILDFGRKGLGW